MKTPIETRLRELAMKIANIGEQGVFEDVLDILQMFNTVTIYVDGKEMELSKDHHTKIGDLLANTLKIPAIKRMREIYRMQYGFVLGLKAAKNAVEDTRNWDTWDTAPKQKLFQPPDHCVNCLNFTKHPNFVQARDLLNKAAEARRIAEENEQCVGPDVLEYDPLQVGEETEAMEAAINADWELNWNGPETAKRRVTCRHCGDILLDNKIEKESELCDSCSSAKESVDDIDNVFCKEETEGMSPE
jgi:ribosomal protein L7/L12